MSFQDSWARSTAATIYAAIFLLGLMSLILIPLGLYPVEHLTKPILGWLIFSFVFGFFRALLHIRIPQNPNIPRIGP
jgi:hypothetical protein